MKVQALITLHRGRRKMLIHFIISCTFPLR